MKHFFFKAALSSFFFMTASTSFSAESKMIVPTDVIVKFKSAAHAEQFMTWMSEQGEQDMYTWMEEADPELAKMPKYDDKKRTIDYSLEQ